MNKRDLLEKIKQLAERGSCGEKENAQELLQKLMLKYNVSEEELSDEHKFNYELRYTTNYEMKLIMQIIYAVQGDSHEFWTYKYGIKKVGYSATKAEHIEIETMYEFYKYHLNKDLDVFYLAFLQKNNIYPPPEKVNHYLDETKLSPEEKQKQKDAYMLQLAMNKHILHKMIEDK